MGARFESEDVGAHWPTLSASNSRYQKLVPTGHQRAFLYTNWRTLEPSNGGSTGNEDCVSYSTPADSWAWNDLDCGGGSTPTLSYIGELD